MCGRDLSSPVLFSPFLLILSLVVFCARLYSLRVNFARSGVGLTAPEKKCMRERVHQTSDCDKVSESVRQCLYVAYAYMV